MSVLFNNNINHSSYNKLSDDVYRLSDNMVIRFNVGLSRNSPDKTKKYTYHKEIAYSDKEGKPTALIRRSFDYFFTIENVVKNDITGDKESVIIGVNNIEAFLWLLQSAIKWFRDKEFDGMFAYKDNKLIIAKRPQSLSITKLPMNKYIELLPTIINTGENEEIPGIVFILSNKNNYCKIPADRLSAVYLLLSKLDMYTAASTLLNYLERPDFGTNLIEFTNSGYNNTEGD